jgi:hypothetical protein
VGGHTERNDRFDVSPHCRDRFDPKPPYDVYAATNGGVAESTNDGKSWTRLSGLLAYARGRPTARMYRWKMLNVSQLTISNRSSKSRRRSPAVRG